MNERLNASAFEYSISDFNAEFENICVQIIMCYNLMIDTKVSVPNDENKIRNKLVNNYLMDNAIREKINLKEYIFDREIPTKNDLGRVDIQVKTKYIFEDTAAYYDIECKRLDNKNQSGKTGLNGEYISNGIARFTNENKYQFYNHAAGMIGFVVSKIDIHENIGFINQLLKNTFTEINIEKELTKKQINPDFEYSYYSCHTVRRSTKIIYHLMFDFSNNIALPPV
jgi:hypothetical protein